MSSSSASPRRCVRCGVELADSTEGLCPRCLMGAAMQPTEPGAIPGQPALAPEDLAPHFPQLEILECLGRGGMGVVYKARQRALNRLVALKLLAPERADDPEFAARFTREAQALAALSHPNIVAVYDFGQAGGFYFLLMEFVDGLNLRQLLKAKKLTPREALSIVPPVCDALQCAHDRGIVHRDIKPENILLDKMGTVKIADFGVAKMMGAPHGDLAGAGGGGEGQTGMVGTPHYAAPEQREANGTADHRADIYSLGVVLYEMLTGERPKEKIELPSARVLVDVRLDEIVLRALATEPERRYRTAGEFKTQVETVAASTAGGGVDPTASPFANGVSWSLFQPPIVREICAHLTEAERREAVLRSFLFGVWVTGTCFGPYFAVFYIPRPVGVPMAILTFIAGVLGIPVWRRMQSEFLCGTAWARQKGFTPEQFRGFGKAGALAANPLPSRSFWLLAVISIFTTLIVATLGLIYMLTRVASPPSARPAKVIRALVPSVPSPPLIAGEVTSQVEQAHLEKIHRLFQAGVATFDQVCEAQCRLSLAEAHGDPVKEALARQTCAAQILGDTRRRFEAGVATQQQVIEAAQRKQDAERDLARARVVAAAGSRIFVSSERKDADFHVEVLADGRARFREHDYAAEQLAVAFLEAGYDHTHFVNVINAQQPAESAGPIVAALTALEARLAPSTLEFK